MCHPYRPFVLIVVPLLTLVPLASASAAPPRGFRGTPRMAGGRMMSARPTMMMPASPTMLRPAGTSVFRTPQALRNSFAFTTPGLGLNRRGIRSVPFGRFGRGSWAMNSWGGYAGAGAGGGYAGGGGGGGDGGGGGGDYSGAPPSGMYPYGDPGNGYDSGQDQTQSAGGGPLVGLLNADGGLDWPLALRILPPGPGVSYLRQQLDARAAEVQRQAGAGQVDPALLRGMSRDVADLQALLADRGDFLPVSQQATNDARLFLRKLQDVLKPVP
jgi:hypothetical protein